MYSPSSELQKWGKKTAETRRRNCAVLPYEKHRRFSAAVFFHNQSRPSKVRPGTYLQNSRMESVRLPSISDM